MSVKSKLVFISLLLLINALLLIAASDQLRLDQLTILAIFILAFFLSIVSLFLVFSIFQPLKKLLKGAQQITKGKWNYDLDIHTGDEIEDLAFEFKRMAIELGSLHGRLDQRVQVRTQELSAEKEVSERLADDLKKFLQAVETTSDQVIIIDVDGKIVYVNESVSINTGIDRLKVVGSEPEEVLWAEQTDKELYKKMWETIREKKQKWQGEVVSKKKDGTTFISQLSIAPILNIEGIIRHFVIIGRDVTKEKEVDRMKTEFVSLASHQLRTPLATIRWYTEILLDHQENLIDKQKEQLYQIYESSLRMIKLVNALLNVSRIELGTFMIEPEDTNIIQLLRSVMDECKPQSDEKQIVIEETHADIPVMRVDPKLTRMIFQNLLTNAIKYTPEKGKVKIDIQLKNNKERIDGHQLSNDSLLISVSDTGYGIPKEQQDKIFTKLFRADNAKQVDTTGTGLGLYIVKSIVDQSQGEIWFKSEENKGTTFFVALPLSGMEKREGTKSLS